MKKIDQLKKVYEKTSIKPGYELLRFIALPDLLGKDQDKILYILGKNTSRTLDITSVDSLIEAFDLFGFGDLVHIKEKRAEDLFTLKSQLVTARKEAALEQSYLFESGIIAGAMETIRGFQCETEESIKVKQGLIEFSVKHYR